jgi:hypothetical protein
LHNVSACITTTIDGSSALRFCLEEEEGKVTQTPGFVLLNIQQRDLYIILKYIVYSYSSFLKWKKIEDTFTTTIKRNESNNLRGVNTKIIRIYTMKNKEL